MMVILKGKQSLPDLEVAYKVLLGCCLGNGSRGGGKEGKNSATLKLDCWLRSAKSQEYTVFRQYVACCDLHRLLPHAACLQCGHKHEMLCT